MVVLVETEGVGGREIIRGSAADLISSCCCCDELELELELELVEGMVVKWSEEEAGEEEVGEVVEEAAARLVVVVVVVDLLLLEMRNLGREGVAVVGRYGEEARGRVERAERSWRGGGMMG